MLLPKYDVLDLKYSSGGPAVLRHVDGSGFAYYQSGRKAICISSHGADGKGKARRFSAIIHQDGARGAIAAIFDEWGRGYVDGQMNAGDLQAPRVMISERSVTVIDGAGTSTEVPSGRTAGGADVALRVNPSISVHHRHGRTTVDFQCGGVSHTFVVGELQGQEVPGMIPAEARHETMQEIGDVTSKLEAVREKVSSLKVDPCKANAKSLAPSVDTSGLVGNKDISDILATLNALQHSLSHPSLAPADLQWNTEGQLKKLIKKAHPECPGQDRRSWTISRVSGKCTDERLANAKPTVASPKSIPQVSQLRLPELIEDTNSTLLVVICLASYAQDQSNHARLIAQRTYAELAKRHPEDGGGPPLVRMVSIELAEMSGFAEHYGIKEVPCCLMFSGSQLVYSKRMSGMRIKARDPGAFKPRVLLVEPNPGQQLKLERGLRRSGCLTDLALDCAQAQRLASTRQQPYTVLAASATLPVAQLRACVDRVRHECPTAQIIAFDAGYAGPPDDDPDQRQRFISECSHVFPYAPGYTALEAVLARPAEKDKRGSAPAVRAGTESEGFLEEVLSVLERGRRGGGGAAFDRTANGAKESVTVGGD